MKLIAGLGNPGKEYAHTWHNIGFMVLDAFQKKYSEAFPPYVYKDKFQSLLTQGWYNENKIVLLKPQTYMNHSGRALYAISQFYKIKPLHIWIIHDDIDLTFGKIRISQKSSSAGHHGVESIIQRLGSKDMLRFRIGISQPHSQTIPTEQYVLQKPNKKQSDQLKKIIIQTVNALHKALTEGVARAMNQYN